MKCAQVADCQVKDHLAPCAITLDNIQSGKWTLDKEPEVSQ